MLCVCLNTPPHPRFQRRKKWQPTPVFLPGKPHEQRSLAGYSSWGRKNWKQASPTWCQVCICESNGLMLHEQAWLLSPSLSPGVCSNSCTLSQWCYLTISSSATLFSFCLQCFPALRSFPMSQPFASGEQRIGASVSASVLPMNIQGWFLLEWTCLIFLQSIRFNYARQPPPVFLPGESQGQRSLVGYSPQGQKELDTTEWLSPAQPSSNGVCVCLCVCAHTGTHCMYILFT